MSIENYDFFCVDFSQRLCQDIESQAKTRGLPLSELESPISKSLYILQDSGVYAFFVHCLWKRNNGTRTEKLVASLIEKYLIGEPGSESLLRLKEFNLPIENERTMLLVGRKLSEDIDALFLAKEILERTLAYARYHAKGLAS